MLARFNAGAAAARMADVARKLVSQKKRRYQDNGFDLDMACASAPPIACPLAQAVLCPARMWTRGTAPAPPSCACSLALPRMQLLSLSAPRRAPADIPRLWPQQSSEDPDRARILAMGIPIPRKLMSADATEAQALALFERMGLELKEGEDWKAKNHPLFVEQAFRNPMDDVQRFFKSIHPSPDGSTKRAKVFNLCIEPDRQYDAGHFEGLVDCSYQFYDHNCPPLRLVPEFCAAANAWLEEDEKNLVAVHCKAGKSRTGLMICSLLLYLDWQTDPAACIKAYGEARCHDGKGVTIPSQQRYIHSYRTMLDVGRQAEPKLAVGYVPQKRPMRLTALKLHDRPERTKYHFSVHDWSSDEPLFNSWEDADMKAISRHSKMLDKGVHVGQWRCVVRNKKGGKETARCSADFKRKSKTVGEIRKGKVLEELESKRDPEDGVLRIKVKVAGTATDAPFTGWVSEHDSTGRPLFVSAAHRDVFSTEYSISVGEGDDAPLRAGVRNWVEGDFKVMLYKEKVNDAGVSVKGDKLTYFWLHTAFMPEPDAEGKSTWTLARDQCDKFKAKGDFLKTFEMSVTLEEVAGPASRGGEVSEPEAKFRALKEERLELMRGVCRPKPDDFVSTDDRLAAEIDEVKAKAEAAIAGKKEALAKARASLADSAEIQKISSAGANQRVDAATVAAAGQQMLGKMIQAGDMQDKLGGLGAEGSDGLALLSSTADPATALQENPEFQAKIKQLVVTYVQDAVMGATIPDISSKKEWGTYEIKGLSVESMDVDPSKLTVEVGSDVRLELTGPPAFACRTPPFLS